MASDVIQPVDSAYSLTPDELAAAIEACGEKPWRARQALQWLYGGQAERWDEMTNMPAALRQALSGRLRDLDGTAQVQEAASEGGATTKLLLKLHDGEMIETVVIPARDRNTVCVSSQVGCAFRCAFCASGLRGVTRSLSPGEIVAQVVRAAQRIGRRPDNIVFMGIGEPFANYDAVLKAARLMNDPQGLGVGARKITISTCGVVPGVERLATEGTQFELSVSLHAPTQALRQKLMPVASQWDIDALIAACRDYTAQTNRIITFEYTLVAGFNDRPEHARLLVALLRGFKCRVNLIPLNSVKEFSGEAPDPRDCEAFLAFLERRGINTTLRRSKGRGVNASCGQLRHRRAATESPHA
ncbi:MAG: 23S rRNA (adenine(2503)-C(2))-methyltransferase RlmN [Kiritimatiellia bacterium]|jgi:23S rRNA (adenine2503-C2)-methyltransferase